MTSRVQEPTDSEPAPRIRLAPLAAWLAGTLLLPVTAAFLLDRLLGLTPWLTLAAALLCIPAATVFVSKAALRDLDRVIGQVAPEPGVADLGPGVADLGPVDEAPAGEHPAEDVQEIEIGAPPHRAEASFSPEQASEAGAEPA